MLNRRQIMSRSAALGLAGTFPAVWRSARASEVVRVGQTSSYTGPFADLGNLFSAGIKAALDQHNAARPAQTVEWITMDDQANGPKALANAEQLVSQHGVKCILGSLSTGVTKALMPFCEERRLPFFPLTGDDGVRRVDQRYTFFSNASYGAETRSMVQHCAKTARRSVFLLHTDLPVGHEWAAEGEAAAREFGLKFTGSVAAKPDGSNAAQVVSAFRSSGADSLIMVYAGNGVNRVLQALHADRVNASMLYLLSQGATPQAVQGVQNGLSGMSVSQVVPNPFRGISPLLSQYLAALGPKQVPRNYLTYQGYLLGRTFLDALQRVSGPVTTASLTTALEQRPIAFRRMVLDYTSGKRLGTNYTDMSMLRSDGRFES